MTSAPSEQDAMRDAYVARLEAALGKIAAGVEPGFGTLSGTMCAEIAREALGEGDIVRIPEGVALKPHEVRFVRWPAPDGEWHLVGPAEFLQVGSVVEIERFSQRDLALAGVGAVVAERVIAHRESGPTRYVVTRIARAVREG
jgi:hypothetical protein